MSNQCELVMKKLSEVAIISIMSCFRFADSEIEVDLFETDSSASYTFLSASIFSTLLSSWKIEFRMFLN